jgi:hypothetical protein
VREAVVSGRQFSLLVFESSDGVRTRYYSQIACGWRALASENSD